MGILVVEFSGWAKSEPGFLLAKNGICFLRDQKTSSLPLKMFTYRLTRLWVPSPNDLPIDDVFFLIIKLLVAYNSLQIYAKLLGVYNHLCRKHHFWVNSSHPLTLF